MRLELHPFQGTSPLKVSPAHIARAQKSPAENGSALRGGRVDTSRKRNGCNKSYIRGRCWDGVREREQMHVRIWHTDSLAASGRYYRQLKCCNITAPATRGVIKNAFVPLKVQCTVAAFLRSCNAGMLERGRWGNVKALGQI